MTFRRVFWPLVCAAGVAACSGNLGSGQSTLPGMPATGTNVQQIAPAPATPTPLSASGVATVGEGTSAQALPNIRGWGGTIAFPQPAAASASPNPKATASPAGVATAASISVGVTASVVEPADSPHFAVAKRRSKHDSGGAAALFFISLLATADVTLAEYPKIAVEVPRDIAAKHRDDTFALALYDPEQKDKAYRLDVAERDLSSPSPGSIPSPAATPVPTPQATPPLFGMPNGAIAFTPPPVGAGLGASSLPPEYIAFKGTAQALTLKANRPIIFAFYAAPPEPSPSPSPSPSAGAPSPSGSAGAVSPSPAAPATAPPTSKPAG